LPESFRGRLLLRRRQKPISPARLNFCSLFLGLLSRPRAQFRHRASPRNYAAVPRMTALWCSAITFLYVSTSLTVAICVAESVTTSASTNPAPMETASITKRAALFASSSESNLSNQYLCLSPLSICHCPALRIGLETTTKARLGIRLQIFLKRWRIYRLVDGFYQSCHAAKHGVKGRTGQAVDLWRTTLAAAVQFHRSPNCEATTSGNGTSTSRMPIARAKRFMPETKSGVSLAA